MSGKYKIFFNFCQECILNWNIFFCCDGVNISRHCLFTEITATLCHIWTFFSGTTFVYAQNNNLMSFLVLETNLKEWMLYFESFIWVFWVRNKFHEKVFKKKYYNQIDFWLWDFVFRQKMLNLNFLVKTLMLSQIYNFASSIN